MADLRVELYGHLIGHLRGTDWRTFSFESDSLAFDEFELGSTILSESVPLEMVQKGGRKARQRNFFTELLPEGRILTNLANKIGAQEYDTIALLATYGRDVAGALQIWDPDRPGEPRTPRVTPLAKDQLEAMLANSTATPLGNDSASGKSSLAGVQDKIVLALIDGCWNQVHDGFPSTHILKPESRDFPTIIFDEEYGCRLAKSLGLAKHATHVEVFNSVSALVVERYDRSPEMPQGRIHQEDMNQALGAHANEKYQEIGGKVSMKRVADVFQKYGDTASLERLAQLLTLSVAIGNLDLHAKNISILHFLDGSFSLAPAYDVVPLRHFSGDGKMAMAVNGKYVHATITADDVVDEVQSWGLRNARTLVQETLEAIAAFIEVEAPHPQAHDRLVEDIQRFTGNLLAGRPAG